MNQQKEIDQELNSGQSQESINANKLTIDKEQKQSPIEQKFYKSSNTTHVEDQDPDKQNQQISDEEKQDGESPTNPIQDLMDSDDLSELGDQVESILSPNQQEIQSEQQKQNLSQHLQIKDLDQQLDNDFSQNSLNKPTKEAKFATIQKKSSKKQTWNKYGKSILIQLTIISLIAYIFIINVLYWKEIQRYNDILFDLCCLGDLENLKLHIEQKTSYPVSINAKQFDDWTALHYASEAGHIKIVKFLLEKNANPEAVTTSKRTSLHLAVLKNSTQIADALLDRLQSLVNFQDKENQTVCHIAAQIGNRNMIKLLLKYKPNLKLKNNIGQTVFDIVRCTEILALLLEYLDQDFEDYLFQTQQNYTRLIFKNERIILNSRWDQVQAILEQTHKIKKAKTLQNKQKLSQNSMNQSQSQPKSHDSSELQITENVSPSQKKKNFFKNLMKVGELQINTVENDTETTGTHNNNPQSVGPDDFLILDVLGQGSFGKVYLVQKKDSQGQLFAMKTLQKDKVFGKNLVTYAKAERNILSIVNHPFIVSLHYAFQTQNKFYMVMDYCPGGDLDQRLFSVQRMKEGIAKIYLAEILLALEFLHENKIVFRDLKPSNVVLDPEGHACLTDFGLSKQGVDKQKLKSFCGSIAYLAPEMLEKTGHNFTIDWYLLGVLGYELLTGYPPFYNENKQKLFQGIKYDKLKFPRYVSQDAQDLIEKLMNRNPDERLGKNGSGEIKSHKFFQSIDWQKALNRELKPPKIPVQENMGSNIPKEKRNLNITISKNSDKESTKTSDQHIENWSFVIPQ